MHRTLQRPMFRRGGSAGDGITSGLRQGYAHGDSVDSLRARMEMVNELAPPSKQGGYDFLMDWGLNMMGNAPTGNIFQTAAKQAQAPFKTFQAGKASERAGQRELAGSLIAGMDHDEVNKIEQEIQMRMEELGETREIASTKVLNKRVHGVLDEPGEQREELLLRHWNRLSNERGVPSGSISIIAEHMTKKDLNEYDELYGKDVTKDFNKGDGFFKKSHWVNRKVDESGKVVSYFLTDNAIKLFKNSEGEIFLDIDTGDLFRKIGTEFILVEPLG